MTTNSEDIKRLLDTPQAHRLKQLNTGLKFGNLFGHYVLIAPITPKTKLDELESGTGGVRLHVPEQTKKDLTPKPSMGIVLKVANAVSNVHPGDAVVFNKFALQSLLVDGTEYGLVLDTDIFCTLVEESEK